MTDETRSHSLDEEGPSEQKIGELLRRHEGVYHGPPETPRESLWARIEAERGTAGGEGGGKRDWPVIPLARRNWWLGTLAVAAVLALGIALGRISMREEADRQGAAGPPVATLEVPAEREPETGAAEEPIAEPGAESSAPEQLAAGPEAAAVEAVPTTGDQADARRVEPVRVAPQQIVRAAAAAEPQAPRPAAATPRDLYQLASQQMLGQAEALLEQYRADRAADRIDPAVGRWARDVLTSTRLLLDSPAADDPGMHDLLEDLELVLAQIVQRTGQADLLDDEMIDRTIEDRDLMPRLRGAIPAGVGAI
ncbi:MAG TPA: hypothetical protein VEY33_01305 [Gemmatimonadota bacterium]|nr:hypothetical protein [Gemmatimonadota bacterium]